MNLLRFSEMKVQPVQMKCLSILTNVLLPGTIL